MSVPASVKKLQSHLLTLNHALTDLIRDEENRRRDVADACHTLRLLHAKEELEQIEVEEIRRASAGIRVGFLREAGYKNLREVDEAADFDLLQINGIGEKQLQAIRSVLATFTEEIASRSSVRLGREVQIREERALVAACARYLKTKPIRQDVGSVSESVRKETEQLLARPVIKNRLRWLLSSSKKKEMTLRAVDDMKTFLESPLYQRADHLMTLYEEATRVTEEEAISLFYENTAPFYALIESVSGEPSQKTYYYDSIPEQLADEVHALTPDLSCFRGNLRSYQLFGVKYILHQKRVLLGDEMGLGKTVEAIAVMAHLAANDPSAHFLVVAPASVLINWCREIGSFSTLSPHLVHGPHLENAFSSWQETGGIAVTNYETMGKIIDRIDNVMRLRLLVIDEAHYIKNPDAKRTRHIRKLDNESERILLMTGTPLENKVDEMCELIDFVRPDLTDDIRRLAYLRNADSFRELIAPVYLRRLRGQVLTELPEIEETIAWCELTEDDLRAYCGALAEKSFQHLRRVSFLQDDMKTSAKAVRLRELCEEAGAEGRRVVVYSFFLETIEKVRTLLAPQCVGALTGSMDISERQRLLDTFAKSAPGSVLVCQVVTGGTGINIQAASVVIFCEPQVKPSLTKQALSRVYRMGQARDVLVYHLLCADTVDEAVWQSTGAKQAEFDLYAEESVMREAAEKVIDRGWIQQFLEEEKKRYLPMVI